jgi:chromosome segregation ATPase
MQSKETDKQLDEALKQLSSSRGHIRRLENQVGELQSVDLMQRSTIARLEISISKLERLALERNEETNRSKLNNSDSKDTQMLLADRDEQIKELSIQVNKLDAQKSEDAQEVELLRHNLAFNTAKSTEYEVRVQDSESKVKVLESERHDARSKLNEATESHAKEVMHLKKENSELKTLQIMLNNQVEELKQKTVTAAKSVADNSSFAERATKLLQENGQLVAQLEELRLHVVSVTDEKARIYSALEDEKTYTQLYGCIIVG